MNKSDLIDAVAQATKDSKASAGRAVNAVLAAVRDGLQKDGHVLLAGFGTFTVKQRAARRGRNPQNGQPIEIPPSVGIHFKPSPEWRNALAHARRQATPSAAQPGSAQHVG